jgi:hypothetical protein
MLGESNFNSIASLNRGNSMMGALGSRMQAQVNSEVHNNLLGKDRSTNVFMALQAMKQEITNASRVGDSDTQHKL